MPRDPIPLRCRCGAVRGEIRGVDASSSNRVVCHCDDCQAYARFLGGEGLVDRHGGTDVFQVAPARLVITSGRERLRPMRLSERGLLRFYAECCRTPVANMLATARSPFVGVPAPFVDVREEERDAVLGPPRAWIQGRFAIGSPAHVHPTAPPSFLARAGMFLARNAIGRLHRGSPFFDPRTREIAGTVQVLTRAERDALRPQGGAGA